MADPLLMDRMFQRIMRGLVETGRTPHYAEVARAATPSPSRCATVASSGSTRPAWSAISTMGSVPREGGRRFSEPA